MAQVIVVGGGLSGLSAAHTVLERGGKVLVLEKNPFLGGNSTKATSGINGALTKTQIKLNIPDSPEKFYDDTAHSARDLIRPDLVKVLTYNSASAVEWLQEKFKLDLSLVSRLGGHSFPRTHRGKEKFPGMTITYALMEKLEDLVKTDSRVRIHKRARVTRLLTDNNGGVIGVEYEHEGKLQTEHGVVVLATGGYAADFAEDGLLKQIRPDLIHLPTTNGDWSTGDGIKMTKAIGGNTVDLEKVQVHPTGLVDPNEPDAKVKFLAAEALRGCGGILLDKNGKRFADELGHRDYVTGQMWKNQGPFRLILNGAAAREIEWHCKHYMGRGLMKFFKHGKDIAAEMGISVDVLKKTFDDYNGFAQNKNDPFGKKYFHNLPFTVDDEFYVAIVTPVLHYTMGGLEINADSAILRGANKQPIPGLFAAGELCGGVHGANRLGGSSLLGCVVYGRVSGDSASRYLFGKLSEGSVASATKRVGALGSQLTGSAPLTATITVEPGSNRVGVEITWDGQGSVTTAPNVPAPAPVQAPAPQPSTPTRDANKEYSWEEVAKHNKESDCWVVVNGQVLNVTSFLKDHPGGKKAILLFAGRDASEEFNMLHKPDVVEKYAPESIIGKISGPAPKGGHAPAKGGSSSGGKQASSVARKEVTLSPSNVESKISGGTADILPQERAKATFDIEKMTNYLDGGVEQTKRRRFIISSGKDADLKDKNSWGPVQQLREHVKHFMAVHEDFWDTWRPSREEIVWMTEYSMFSGSMMNHYGLFYPTLTVHASDEQKKWWVEKALTMKMVGCYAQTELGHGSNVRGLRTTAEYDKKTQQFILNTPTLTSMKWWPGTLGKVATHALVYAQLILDGKEHGVHSFMLQIRDENHMPLPGIELGDLGPKLGDNANDTGYMRLDNVRIPREFMLAKYQQVTPDGQYIKSAEKEQNAKLAYTTMIFTRGAMVKTAGGNLAKAVTIATRYSCVRTQGFVDTKTKSYKSVEKPIMDHQVQRYRVLRQLALCYAMKFTGHWMLNKFKELEGGDKELKNVSILPEIAATSGGLKALCTYMAWFGIEDCRKCCGGNGYLMSSGVAPLAANYVWQTTAEGDWIILMLQTGMFLLKVLKHAAEGKQLSDIVSYLTPLQQGFDIQSAKAPVANSTADFQNPEFLLALFRHLALIRVVTVGQEFQNKLGELNGNFNDAVNAVAVELCTAVRAHCFCFMLNNFVKGIHKAPSDDLKKVLGELLALFATSNIIDDSQWTGILTAPQVQLAKTATAELLNTLRPNAVALVDAFDIPDRVLGSTIGRYDGNVYEALYESALRSPLNQIDPFEGYHEYLSPHLDKYS